jgi:hypothetical protein
MLCLIVVRAPRGSHQTKTAGHEPACFIQPPPGLCMAQYMHSGHKHRTDSGGRTNAIELQSRNAQGS